MVPQLSPARDVVEARSSSKALPGFLLSGFLLALLGAILPAWGYHRDPPRFLVIGDLFLALGLGVSVSVPVARWLERHWGRRFLLVAACAMACLALIYLAATTVLESHWWPALGLFWIGMDAGLLNTALFELISGAYREDPAGTVIRGGIFYGLGCLASSVLVAGTFYAYSVVSILILMSAVPAVFAVAYARSPIAAGGFQDQIPVRQVLRDFRSPGAVLFALLLFFQFGNEWSVAGWLPLFLIRRLGASPESALLLLTLYWASLLVGRVVAVTALPHVRRGRVLTASVLGALFGCLVLVFTNNRFGAGAAILLLGFGYSWIYPLVAEKIGRRFPDYHPGFFNSIFSFALLGAILAPATLGYAAHLLDEVGVVMVLPLIGTVMVLVLYLMIWLETIITGR